MFKKAGLQVTHREIVDKKHNYESWAKRQNCSQAIKEKLVKMVREAPVEVLAWIRPSGFGRPQAIFLISISSSQDEKKKSAIRKIDTRNLEENK